MSDSLRPHGLWPTRLLSSWDFPGMNTGVGCHFLLQGIFPTQGSNLGRSLTVGRRFTIQATTEAQSACQWREIRFDLCSRSIPCVSRQLSPRATITELTLWIPHTAAMESVCCNYLSLLALEPVLYNKRSYSNDKPMHCN